MNIDTRAGGMEDSQVQVHFVTDLSEKYHVPNQLYMIPTSLTRHGLSEVINGLLELPRSCPFDFLIDNIFLRSTLATYMAECGVTSEVALTVSYVLPLAKPRTVAMPPEPDWISSIAPLPEAGAVVVTGSYDGSVRIYSRAREGTTPQGGADDESGSAGCPQTLKVVATYRQSAVGVTAVTSSSIGHARSDCAFIACGAQDGTVKFSRAGLAADNVVHTVHRGKRHQNAVSCLTTSPDKCTVASGGLDSRILLWSNMPLTGPTESPGDDSAKQHSTKGTRKRGHPDEGMHNVEAVEPRGELKGHTQAVNDIAYPQKVHPFSLFSTGLDLTLRVWDSLSLTEVASWTMPSAATSLSICPDTAAVATAHDDGKVRVWDPRCPSSADSVGPSSGTDAPQLNSYTRFVCRQSYHVHSRQAPQVRWNPLYSHLLTSVSHDGQVKIYDTRCLNIAQQAVTLPNDVKLQTVCWADPSSIATGGSDGVLRMHFLSL